VIGPSAYHDLRRKFRVQDGFSWLPPLLDTCEQLLDSHAHGDLSAWRQALRSLPATTTAFDGSLPAPRLGQTDAGCETLAETLAALHPWRKGPLEIGGVRIDTEWRSDWKWQRIEPHIDLSGHRVLDVGCGNGYFGWRMLGAGAESVLGIDPTLVFVMQWLASRHFAGEQPNWVLPLGIERLPQRAPCFDSVFSMGVLYHRKDPVEHLRQLAGLVRPGGQLVLETLVLDGDGIDGLVPEGRYARMRNVWSIPTLGLLRQWLKVAGLPAGEVLDVTSTSTDEQRSTEWMRFESLAQALDPADCRRTVEGYPAPLRAALRIEVPDCR